MPPLALRTALLLASLLIPWPGVARPVARPRPTPAAPAAMPHPAPAEPVLPVLPAPPRHGRGGGPLPAGVVPLDPETVQVFTVTLPPGCTRLVAVGDDHVRNITLEVLGPGTEHIQQDADTGTHEELPLCPLHPGDYEVRVHTRGDGHPVSTRLYTVAPDGTRREVTAPSP